MGTRSNIGYLHPKTGMYHYIYCHWDGYLSWNGRILRDHYKTLQKVKMLVNLGAISALKKNVRPPKKVMTRSYAAGAGGILVPAEKHTFDTPDRNTVVAYHRDRNEPWEDVKPTISDQFPVEQEWAYCFKDGKWLFKTTGMNAWLEIPQGDLKVAQEKLYTELGY
jgi:hypothetical protein